MKKAFAFCAGVALLTGAMLAAVPTVAHAQASGPFADVPTDHWAYQAVDTLQKAGIVIGYPDGTYGGKRAMTRYEFATAIARLLPLISKPVDTSNFATKDDLAALQTDLEAKLAANQAALDALKALVNEFQAELQQLGQDVAAIKTRLAALEQRVAAVEAEQRRVRITGETQVIGRANINTGHNGEADPLDKDGYRIGTVGNKSLFNDPNVYHDVLLTITGQVSDTAQAVIKLDAGNYLPTLGSATSLSTLDNRNATAPTDDFNIYRAYLDAPVALGPLGGAEAVVGRFGEQFTPFTLKAIDPDSYGYSPETDSGDVTTDGAKLSFAAGAASVQLYAGKNAPIEGGLYTLTAGPNTIANSGAHLPGSVSPGGETFPVNTVDQSAGGRITVGTPDSGVLGVTGLLVRTTATGADPLLTGGVDPHSNTPYDTLGIYGADYNGLLPFFEKTGITFDGDYAIATTGSGSRFGNDNSSKGNEAYKAELGYSFGPLNIKGGYENVYANFAAPGYWGKLGDWTNPTNIEGGIVSAVYTISPQFSLVGDGNFFQGKYNVGEENPLGKDDKVNQFDVGLKSALSSAYSVDLGYEYVQYNLKNDQGLLANSGKPTEEFITFGIGHPLNKNASVKLLYQVIEYNDKNTGFDPDGNSRGGVALTQFSLKF